MDRNFLIFEIFVEYKIPDYFKSTFFVIQKFHRSQPCSIDLVPASGHDALAPCVDLDLRASVIRSALVQLLREVLPGRARRRWRRFSFCPRSSDSRCPSRRWSTRISLRPCSKTKSDVLEWYVTFSGQIRIEFRVARAANSDRTQTWQIEDFNFVQTINPFCGIRRKWQLWKSCPKWPKLPGWSFISIYFFASKKQKYLWFWLTKCYKKLENLSFLFCMSGKCFYRKKSLKYLWFFPRWREWKRFLPEQTWRDRNGISFPSAAWRPRWSRSRPWSRTAPRSPRSPLSRRLFGSNRPWRTRSPCCRWSSAPRPPRRRRAPGWVHWRCSPRPWPRCWTSDRPWDKIRRDPDWVWPWNLRNWPAVSQEGEKIFISIFIFIKLVKRARSSQTHSYSEVKLR